MTTNKALSRRALLGGMAVTGSALALEACGDDAPPATTNPDIAPLNSLLAAEYGAIAAYTAGIPLLMNPQTGDPQAASGPILAAVATEWLRQHNAHAAQLATTITGLGGTPVAQSSVTFTPPTGFMPASGPPPVRNVMVLACNAEKAAAVAYNQAVKSMNSPASRYLAANIEGSETQHFVILYTLLKQVVVAGGGIVTMVSEIAPKSFVGGTGTDALSSIADFTYTA